MVDAGDIGEGDKGLLQERKVTFTDGIIASEFRGDGGVVDFSILTSGPGKGDPFGGEAIVEVETPDGKKGSVGMFSIGGVSYLVMPDGQMHQGTHGFVDLPPMTIGASYPLFGGEGTKVARVVVRSNHGTRPGLVQGVPGGENPFPALRAKVEQAITLRSGRAQAPGRP